MDSTRGRLTLRNPVDDSIVVDDVVDAGKADVDRAVASAKKAFRQGAWATYTGQQRAACLNRFADVVEKNIECLAYAESLPSGRPVAGLIHFDLAHMVQVYRCKAPEPLQFFSKSGPNVCFECSDYAGWADKIHGQFFAEDNGVAKIVRYEPLGVCASIASWNSTFLYIGWKLAPALAAGNTV